MSSESATAVKHGCLVVISGPSGAGKTSICNALLERLPDAMWSISATTRPKRSNEKDDQNYHFITREQFDAMKERGEFLETAEYVGNWYGTPLKPVEEAIALGQCVIMEIEVQGGVQVAKKVPNSIRVFVLPPTRETLEARLKGRKTESEDQQKRRLAEADGEIGFARDSACYQYFVTNDVLEDTVDEVIDIINRERSRINKEKCRS